MFFRLLLGVHLRIGGGFFDLFAVVLCISARSDVNDLLISVSFY